MQAKQTKTKQNERRKTKQTSIFRSNNDNSDNINFYKLLIMSREIKLNIMESKEIIMLLIIGLMVVKIIINLNKK
jgi:hypothetical protein